MASKKLLCLECGHTWVPLKHALRRTKPALCPKCTSKYWDGGRPERSAARARKEPIEWNGVPADRIIKRRPR